MNGLPACPEWCTADHIREQQSDLASWGRASLETGEPVDPQAVADDLRLNHRSRILTDEETGLAAQVDSIESEEPVLYLSRDGHGFELPLRYAGRIADMVADAVAEVGDLLIRT